ncbi:MAG TPA: ATP-dependent Clp protease proteolytic subunit [Bryobacteraceae bacterium]|nr:ATP-dependent Clp protease proteolytic subunit [Bryobacteraceae bacterium]
MKTVKQTKGEASAAGKAGLLEELVTKDVFLFGQITDIGASEIVQAIEQMRHQGKKLRLWICSVGGDLGGALAIHDALTRDPQAEAIATGNCQSAALLVLLGAAKRWATGNTIFFNHAVRGALGEFMPQEFTLPALEILEKLPKGMFGPDVAEKCGLLTALQVSRAAAGGEYTGSGTVGIGPL